MIVAVMYPAKPNGRFDLDYYMQKHIPLVKARWESCGLREVRVLRGTGAPGGEATYGVVALLRFGSMADFERAGREHGKEVLGDIPNFTDAQPVMQFCEELA